MLPSVTHDIQIPFFLLLVCHNYFLISVIRQMDEEAVFQTAFFLKEFLYTEKKTLEFSENTKVFLENSKVFSEKMKEFFRTIPYDK